MNLNKYKISLIITFLILGFLFGFMKKNTVVRGADTTYPKGTPIYRVDDSGKLTAHHFYGEEYTPDMSNYFYYDGGSSKYTPMNLGGQQIIIQTGDKNGKSLYSTEELQKAFQETIQFQEEAKQLQKQIEILCG